MITKFTSKKQAMLWGSYRPIEQRALGLSLGRVHLTIFGRALSAGICISIG